MDLQMPEMDGFAATAAIRALEKASGRHLPIVAMTARAMKGDRECCLAAGMDGYISKPVNPKQLLAIVDTLSVSRSTELEPARGQDGASDRAQSDLNPSRPSTDTVETLPVVDFDSLMERVENDTALLDEMLELYQETSPRLLSDIESGVQTGDANMVRHAAHSLKGALQNLSATAGARAAMNLEKMAATGACDGSEESLLELKRQLHRLQGALNDWSRRQCV
jgi:CheY-like chemotaxis protein